MIWLFVAAMVASALFDVWMLIRSERLRIERDEWQASFRNSDREFRRLLLEVDNARKFNEVNR